MQYILNLRNIWTYMVATASLTSLLVPGTVNPDHNRRVRLPPCRPEDEFRVDMLGNICSLVDVIRQATSPLAFGVV
jgi:hypothetical protein